MSENMKEWLDSLKVGDEVAVSSHWDGYSISTITKITPTKQIEIAGHSQKFKNGELKLDSFHWLYLYPVTNEIRESIFRNATIIKLRTFKYEGLSTDQLKRILKITKEDVKNN